MFAAHPPKTNLIIFIKRSLINHSLWLLLILFPQLLTAQVLTLNGTALPAGGGSPSSCTAGSYKTLNSATVSGNCLSFTSGAFQNGAIWACSSINLNQSFKLSFQINLGSNANTGDGIAFVLQTEGVPQVIGGRAGGLGYALGDGSNCQLTGTCPIEPSVAVEFDTWDNTSAGNINDIACNHLSIQKNGNMSAANSLVTPTCLLPGGVSAIDGLDHNVCITWDPSINNYSVFFDGIRIASYNGNIRTNFVDPSNVYWGFTGASGGSAQTQKVCNVSLLTNIASPSCPCTATMWSGSANTIWGEAQNWGGCSSPDCPVSAVVAPSANQPVLLTGQTYRVSSLTINAGATVTMQAGSILEICGNYNNLGSLVANPGATIKFVGTAVQTISGLLTGANKFPNIIVDKTAGSVLLNNDLDVGGSFTTQNNLSIFNSNSKYLKVAGNFSNATGNTTYLNPGTLEFNGSTTQNYNQGTIQLDLKVVTMNNTAANSGVNLLTNMCMRSADGQLNLLSGKIITGLNEVRQYNTLPAAVTTGSAISYVEGYLRRRIVLPASAVSYDFPVGHSLKGYQRANILFNSNQNIDNLLASFTPYSTLPAALNVTECNRSYNLSALDNGKWIIDAYNSSFSRIAGTANYTMTLYNRNYTNAGSSNAWTIMKDSVGAGTWYLNGNCDTTSLPTLVRRSQMTGFSHFGTAQGGITLPVELISFQGESKDGVNQLSWSTASELNNDHFEILRSSDANEFVEIGQVVGSGTTSIVHNYEFSDRHPLAGLNYYQLRQVDFDGAENPSPVIVVNTKSRLSDRVQVRPNPNNGIFTVDFFNLTEEKVVLQFTDPAGRPVYRQELVLQKGVASYSLDLSKLSNGVYTMTVSTSEGSMLSEPKYILIGN
jgi:hypothetical protein